MKRGWFKAHAMDEKSSYYQLTPNYRSVWWELLGWADRTTGTVVINLTYLAKRAGISKQLCRAALMRLAKLGMVKKLPLPTVHVQGYDLFYDPQHLQIVNWSKFQATPQGNVLRRVLPDVLREQEVASPTEKRAAKNAAPKVSPFPPAFWRVLKHYGCPQLDRADKGQVLQRLKAGELLEDLVAKIVIGISYGARSPRGALTYTRQFNDPITRLEMDDVRSAYRRLAAEEHGPRDGAGRRAGDSTAQPPAQLGLPEVGAADQAELGTVHGSGGQAGAVQDDLGVDDGGEPRASWEAGLLDRVGDAPRADGSDVGLAAGPYPTQEAGGRVETRGSLDLR